MSDNESIQGSNENIEIEDEVNDSLESDTIIFNFKGATGSLNNDYDQDNDTPSTSNKLPMTETDNQLTGQTEDQNISLMLLQMMTQLDHKMTQNQTSIESKIKESQAIFDNRMTQNQTSIENKIKESQTQNQTMIRDIEQKYQSSQEQASNKLTQIFESQQTIESSLNSTNITIAKLQTAITNISLDCKERAERLEKEVKGNAQEIKFNSNEIMQLRCRAENIEVELECNKSQFEVQANALDCLRIKLNQALVNTRIEQPSAHRPISLRSPEQLDLDCQVVTNRAREQPCTSQTHPRYLEYRPQGNARIAKDRDSAETSPSSSDNDSRISCENPTPPPKRRRCSLRMQEPIFSNDHTQTAPEFVEEINRYYEETGVLEERDKIMNLPQFLRGNAARWCKIQLKYTTSWKHLCDKFIAQYFNKKEIAQEWESLDYREANKDCEGFVLKAWQLQTILNKGFSTQKKCANIIRKLPYYLQGKIKERDPRDFDEFLRNVKEIEKSSYLKYKERKGYNNSTPPLSPKKTNQTPKSPPKAQFKQETQSQPYKPYQEKFRNPNQNWRPQNRKWTPNNKKWHRDKPYENRDKFNRNRDNTGRDNNAKKLNMITLMPIEGKPGSYAIAEEQNNVPRATSPKTSKQKSPSQSPSPTRKTNAPNASR